MSLAQVKEKTVGRVSEKLRARQAREDALRPEFCLNCGAKAGKYCPECGQENTPYALHVGDLLRDVWDEFIKADNKFFRTMIPLLFRPGFVTKQYAEGKRARYLSPFRLYLVVSAVFFTVLAKSSFTTEMGQGFTLGQQIARAEIEKKEAEAAAASRKPTTVFHTHPMRSEPSKIVNWSASGLDDMPALRVAGRNVDWKHAPATWADYEKNQARLEPKKRDDWLARWLTGRVIAARGFTFQSYFAHVLDMTPKVMFVMMPVFALLLKLLYFRRSHRYIEHFVLALHIHTVYFLLSTVILLVPLLAIAEPLLIAFYGFWAMKTVYGQGLGKTFLKWLLLSWNYGWASLIGGLLAMLLSFVV